MSQTNYSKILRAYQNTLSSLKDIQKYQNLPQEIKNLIIEVESKVKDYDVEQHKEPLDILTGDMLSAKEIKDIVIEASGYNKWEVYSEEAENLNFLQTHYGVDTQNIEYFMCEREVNSRSELFLLRFYVLPGHVFICLDTGRVGYDSEKVLKNKDIAKFLRREFN